MENKSFYHAGIVIGCISLIVGWFYLDTETSETFASPQETNTQSKSAITIPLKQSSSQATWGKSPFEVGYEDVEIAAASTKKSPAKPNLIWPKQTFTLKDGRTLTYEFGKGNPTEVAMLQETTT